MLPSLSRYEMQSSPKTPSYPRIVSAPHRYVNRTGFSIHLARCSLAPCVVMSVSPLLAPPFEATFLAPLLISALSFRVSVMWEEGSQGSRERITIDGGYSRGREGRIEAAGAARSRLSPPQTTKDEQRAIMQGVSAESNTRHYQCFKHNNN